MTHRLLCLTGIFKNEAAGIVRTLESAKPHIDCWAICDTGSDDGTQDLIVETLTDIPGKLYHPPFVDFATTRNVALEYAAESGARYNVMLSGDETLESLDRKELEAGKARAYDTRILFGDDMDYRTVRAVECGSPWRYEGVTHEAMVGPDGEGIGGVIGTIRMRPASPEAKVARWQIDRELLEAELAKNPTHARACFYLAQTYACLGDPQKALDLYRVRADMGGWHEERFEAVLRAGGIASACGADRKHVERFLLFAHLLSPHRAEPLYELSKYYAKEQMWEPAFWYATQACERPYPVDDRLFVNRSVYEWRARDAMAVAAFYLPHRREEAAAMNRQLLDGGKLPAADRERVERNLSYSTAQAA